jgi:hypothetical protein
MRYLLASICLISPTHALADANHILSQNCLALVAYQTVPESFRADVALAFDSFVVGSQMGRRAGDVMPAFRGVCAANPQLSITGAMRKAVPMVKSLP